MRHSRCLVSLASLGAAVIGTGLVGGPAAAQMSGSSCPTVRTRDFAAAMRGFPAIRHVPASGHFPFGPRKMSITPLGSAVQAGRGRIGFRIGLFPRSGARHHLGWAIHLDVTRLSANGAERRPVAERLIRPNHSQEVGREEASIGALVSGVPAYYRLDIAIDSASGAVLGNYSEYVRVVPPTISVKLALNGDVFRPGDLLVSRIENRGTVGVNFQPVQPRLERETPAGWRTVPQEKQSSIGVGMRVFVVGGGAGPCNGLRLPTNLPVGRYRVSETVAARSHSVHARAGFRVQ
jgi:hypothetical protein